MKKIILGVVALIILAGGAFLVYQNLPDKKYGREMTKARLHLRQNDLDAARSAYQRAYESKGGYTPYVSTEVLEVENLLSLKENDIDKAIQNTLSFLEKNPKNKNAMLNLAAYSLQAGRIDRAFEAVNNALNVDPLFFPARYMLANIRLKQGRPDLAEDQIRILADAYPDSLQATLPLVRVLMDQGKVSESKQWLRSIIEKHPENAQARLLLVDAFLKAQQVDSSQMALDDWASIDSATENAVALRKARIYSLVDKLKEAEEALTPYQKLDKDHIPLLSEMAIIKVKQGEIDSALKIYDQIAELNPSLAPQSLILAHLVHMYAQKPAKALELVKKVHLRNQDPEIVKLILTNYASLDQKFKAVDFIGEQPDSLQPMYKQFLADLVIDRDFLGKLSLITYYKLNNQNYWTFRSTQELYELHPKNQFIAMMHANQHASLGNFKKAIEIIEKLPNHTLAHQGMLMGWYNRSGQNAKAAEIAESLLGRNPRMPGVNAFLGTYYMEKGNAQKANEYFEKELEVIPDHPVALNNLAWHHGVIQKNLEKAQPYLEKLDQLGIKDPRVLDTQGWIYATNGKPQKADSLLQLAVNLLPDNPSILYHSAYTKLQLDKKEKAVEQLKKALSLQRPWDERKEAEALLAKQEG